MLQQDQPEDFVIATGEQFSVRQFVEWSASELGISVRFEGTGVNEMVVAEAVNGDDAPAVKPGAVIARVDPRYFRPTEVETLLGDPAKAKERLGWTPEISARQMCAEMVECDLAIARQNSLLRSHGFDVAVPLE